MSDADSDQSIKARLHAILAEDSAGASQSLFQDADGLISFVNMSSSLVTSSAPYTTGRTVCDMVLNFFCAMRIKAFGYLRANPSKVLCGDTIPTTQWAPAVTHFMLFLLSQTGGMTNHRTVTETYSATLGLPDFSTAFIKRLSDAASAQQPIITDVVNFIMGVGQTLRVSWDDRSRKFATAILGQCHEAVPVDSSGSTVVYFPKIKYYYVSIDSSQRAFTSPCTGLQKLTFNFAYEYCVAGLAAAVLDSTSAQHKSFVEFLNRAQAISYKDSANRLDAILDNTVSDAPSQPEELGRVNVFGMDLSEYPRITCDGYTPAERVLNPHAPQG